MSVCANYTSSLEPVEASLAGTSLDTQLSPQLKLNPTASKSSSSDKPTEYYLPSLFSETSESSTETLGEEKSTSYAEAFLAKIYQALGGGLEYQGNEAGCGQKWPGSLAKYDPDTHSWKTHQCSLLGGLESFSETFPKWGMMRHGELWELPTLERPIKESEFGFSLPTPMKSDASKPQINSKVRWLRASKFGSRVNSMPYYLLKNYNIRLSPKMSEWVMGWPESWTDLAPLETDKFQSWQQQHGGF